MPVNHFNKLRKSSLVNVLFSSVISNLVLFAQPLQQVIANQYVTKIHLPQAQGNGYIKNQSEEELVSLNDFTPNHNDNHNTVVPDSKMYNETAKVYYAIEKDGIIGKLNSLEGENPYDNFFSIDLPNDIDTGKYKVTLVYELYGIKSASQTTKSINNHNAYGGQIVESSNEWLTVKEQIPAEQLKVGKNEIYFNRRDNNIYQYKVRNLRIGLEPINNSTQICEGSVLKYKDSYYLQGIISERDVKSIEVEGHSIPVINGIFEYIFSELPEDLKGLNISYQVTGKNSNLTMPVTESAIQPIFISEENNVNTSQTYSYNDLLLSPLSYKSICVDLKNNDEYKKVIESKLLIHGLLFKDIRITNEDIENVTEGDFSAYRIKQIVADGSLPLQIHLKYDETEIPDGYTAKDIRTFYFDKNQRSWKALPVDSLDYENKEIISTIASNGETDYINGVIKMPDSPEVGSFAPTMMSDMKYADPTAGVVSIAPPTPNSNGTASTSFPIKVPTGRVGMQPSLQVSYNSEKGNGWMGIGWSLATPAISINTKWGVPRFDINNESEIYMLNGSDLVLKNTSGEYTNPHRDNNIGRNAERRFYERKEGAYKLIVRHGDNPNNYWWEVTDKQGNKSFYGGWYNTTSGQYQFDDNSVIRDDSSNSNITHWALKATLDTYGNYTLYEYESSTHTPFSGSSIQAKDFYLSNIKYTLFDPQSAISGQSYYMVDFKRNVYSLGGNTINRNDVIINGRDGYFNIIDDILTEIHISYNESGQSAQRIRSYKFDYEEKAFNKQQLVTISEYDKSNSLFYSNTIEYYDYDDENTSIIKSQGITYGDGSSNNDVSSTLFDIAGVFGNAPNGSVLGTSTASGYSLGIRFGGGIGFNSGSVNTTIGGGYNYSRSNSETKISFIDINGDGLPDKVYNSINGVYYKPNKYNPYFEGTDQEYTWGDGISLDGISSLTKTKSTTNSFSGDVNVAGFGVGTSSSKTKTETDNYFTDFNGDGLPDMVRGNRVRFNKHQGTNINERSFDADPADTENPIYAGQVSEDLLNDIEFDPINIVYEEHPQFDHIKVWQAPKSGNIAISGNAILRHLNDVNNVPISLYSTGIYENEVEVRVEKGNLNTNNASIIIGSQILENIDYNYPITTTVPVSVNKGDFIFFRIHNNEYGTGAEVEWNPQITYIETPSVSGVTDENGKFMYVFNAEEDHIPSSGGGYVSAHESFSNCNVNFNIPATEPAGLTDQVRFVVKRTTIHTDPSSGISTTSVQKYIKTYGDSNIQTIPVNSNANNDCFLEFYVESDSNIDWSLIDWNPSYYFDSNTSNINYPTVGYLIYNNNINNVKYWLENNQLIQPNMSSGNSNDPFLKVSHNYFDNWDNIENNLIPDPRTTPKKLSWVIKAKTSQGEVLLYKRVYYIHYDIGAYEYYFTSTEAPNTGIIYPETNDTYTSINIGKATIDDIYNAGGKIFSAFYISEEELVNNSANIRFELNETFQDPLDYPDFQTQTINKPFFLQKKSFYGTPYRGWGQFLYNGGIKLFYSDGEPTNQIDAYYYKNQYNTAIGIDVTLFDYESQAEGIQENVNSGNTPDPSPVRYILYESDNVNNKYTVDGIINDSSGQIGVEYGYNDNSELTAKIGRFAESSVFDQFFDPETITQSIEPGPVIAIKQYTRSKGSSVSFEGSVPVLGENVTSSEANSGVQNMYIDMNGDRYPDMVTKSYIQYTNMFGGLQDTPPSQTNFSIGETSEDDSVGITISGIFPSSTGSDNPYPVLNADGNSSTATTRSFNKTSTNINSGIVIDHGRTLNPRQYLDINGDGLPDRVSVNGNGVQVQLNTGYGFTESFMWEQSSGLSVVSTRESSNFNISGGASGNTNFVEYIGFSASFAAGVGAAKSIANMETSFADVNGDGLPDLLIKEINNYTYYLNTGSGFVTSNFNAPDVFYNGNSLEQDSSLVINGFGSGTGGIVIIIPILPPPAFIPLKFTATGSGSGNGSISEKNITMQDWNGDGYIDVLHGNSDNNSTLTANYNTIDKTYLLRKVNTPLGGSWEITYKRDGNTYKMPQSRWTLKSVITNDGFDEDSDYKPNTSEIAVTYNTPNYDRREREFYGYKNVIIEEKDPGTSSTYRTVAKTFHNENYYLSGIERYTKTYSSQGTISESTTLYNLLNPDTPIINMDAVEEDNYLQASLIGNAETLLDKSRLLIVPVRVTSKVYENGSALTTVKDFAKYDQYGNLLQYIDYGIDENDTYKTVIDYYDPTYTAVQNIDNATGFIRRSRVIRTSDNEVMRYKNLFLNNNKGKVERITTNLNSLDNLEINSVRFYYDIYGNLNIVRDLNNLNESGAHFTKSIYYDDKIHTYPIRVANAFGEDSLADYDYLFGIPTLTTDMNGQQMRTRIDDKGRITEVTGPNEMALESVSGPDTAWTIRMEYENSFVPGENNPAQHHAITRHFDPEYANGTNITTNELLTVSIVDGLGQPIQVKKTHFSDTTKWLISGFEKKDAFGRVLESYLPVTQTYNSGNSPDYYHVAIGSLTDEPVTMTYDDKNRVKTVKQPGETDISSIDYSISDSMLVQKVTNQNDGTTQTLDTYTDIRGRQRKTVQNGTKTIIYTYNAINELLKVTDENSETSYKYDLGGRVIEVRQPDRGLITYKYDNASRLIEQSNSNLIINGNQTIKYHYDFGRLVKIEYPQNPLNEVKYTYGEPNDPLATAENAVGRLLKQEDATGVQVFGYGRMGEVTKNLRSVAVAGHHSFWFFTRWKYDSWNRISEIIYPDGEIVTYNYNQGGMVKSIESEMGDGIQNLQPVVSNIVYNDYGERTSITYGNGTSTTYNYDERRRMNSLQHNFAGNYQVNKEYTYDVLSNITKIETLQPQNSLPGQEQLGGPVYHEYTYDNFNRLTHAEGYYTGSNDIGTSTYLRQEYELDMEYNTDHTIRKKSQAHWQGEVSSYGPIQQADKIPVHKTSYILDYSEYASGDFVAGEYGYVQQHAPRKIVETPGWVTNPAQDDPRIREKIIEYDANGNQTEIKEKVGELEISLRKNLWDEENRLIGVDLKPDDHDNRPVAVYTYDAGGQRTVRYNYDRIDVYSNADQVGTNVDENIMIYPSGLIMGKVRETDDLRDIPLIYTKHYYIGAERVSAKTATAYYLCHYPEGTLDDVMPDLQTSMVRPDSNQKVVDAGTIVTGAFNTFGVTPPTLTPDYTPEDNEIFGQEILNNHDPNRLEIFYFHPDHLGSSSYITNKAGTVSQHMEYLPFGETLVDEHLNSINSPFKYNGKELDDETGNYYYSARYYDPKFSIFISVDPLVENTWDAYGYCYQNPINLTDPTGMSAENDDIIDIDKKTGRLTITKQEGKDIVRLIDSENNNEVIDSYVYGENGSFKKDTKLEAMDWITEYEQGYKVFFTDFTKADKFYKFAAKSDVEFGHLAFFFSNSTSGLSVVATSHQKGKLSGTEGIIDSFLKNYPNVYLTYDSHSHPSKFDMVNRPPRPSGFNPDLTIGPLDGDRNFYLHLQKKYPGRIPDFFEVYTPSVPNVEVKYNGEKATRKIK